MRKLVHRLVVVVDSKLGRCPFCMRTSLYGSAAAWLAVFVLALCWPARIALAGAFAIAGSFTLLALAHLVAHSVRVWRFLKRTDCALPSDHTKGREGVGRRAFLREAVRSSAAFALVAAFGSTVGLARNARAQTTCSGSGFDGTALGASPSSKGDAQKEVKLDAELDCAAFCASQNACPTSKPTCKGSAQVRSLNCSYHDSYGGPGWFCDGTYTCNCACGK